MNKPLYIIIHHTATDRDKTTFQSVNENHKQRGFTRSSLGYYVGYHYLIGANGQITQARSHNEAGCHCVADGMNYKSIGIGLTGNFNTEIWTQAQLKSLEKIVLKLENDCSINRRKNVLGHFEVRGALTDCPGNLVYWIMAHRLTSK